MGLFKKKHAASSSAAAAAAATPPPSQPSVRPVSRNRDNPGRQMVRETDRTANRAKRDMHRENLRLEAEEKKIIAEMRKLARQGREKEARMLARNLVQVRNAKQRTLQAGTQMSALSNQARMAQADATMMGVMENATGIMQTANGVMDPQKQQNVIMQYDMHSQQYKLNQEMTDEVLDSALGDDAEIDAGTEDVLNSVLDEIGLEVTGTTGKANAPTIRPQAQKTAQAAQKPSQQQQIDEDELLARIDRL